jgi:hypothetical protein
MKSVSFDATDGFSDSVDRKEASFASKTRQEVSAVIEGGAQGLLDTFFRTKLHIPGARFERLDRERSKITTLKRNRKRLKEAIDQLPPIFKTTIVDEAA